MNKMFVKSQFSDDDSFALSDAGLSHAVGVSVNQEVDLELRIFILQCILAGATFTKIEAELISLTILSALTDGVEATRETLQDTLNKIIEQEVENLLSEGGN